MANEIIEEVCLNRENTAGSAVFPSQGLEAVSKEKPCISPERREEDQNSGIVPVISQVAK